MEGEICCTQKNIGHHSKPAHINISVGGVAKYATNKNEAIKLLEFLASPKEVKDLLPYL